MSEKIFNIEDDFLQIHSTFKFYQTVGVCGVCMYVGNAMLHS